MPFLSDYVSVHYFFYSFFIILNGYVSIHINTTYGVEDERQEEEEQEQPAEVTERRLSTRLQTQEHQDGGKPKELDRTKFGNYVGRIGKTKFSSKVH